MNIETPQQKRMRSHEEDKKKNPKRHLITKQYYSYEEALSLCNKCAREASDKYGYCPMTQVFWRKTGGFIESK